MTVVVPMIIFTDAYALIDRFVVDAQFATVCVKIASDTYSHSMGDMFFWILARMMMAFSGI